MERNKRTDTTYKYDFGEKGSINAGNGACEGECFYLGAHFVNDLYDGGKCSDSRKKYNAEFEDLYIRAIVKIHSDTEIFVNYNRRKTVN